MSISEDTYIYSENGLLTLKELFKSKGFDTFCVFKNIQNQCNLVNENGKYDQSEIFNFTNKKPLFLLKTNGGLEIKATFNHPVKIINNQGMTVWKNVGNIKENDSIIVLKGMNINHVNNNFDESDARLLAYVLAEGSLTKSSPNKITFTNQNDGLLKDFEDLLVLKFGFDNCKKYADDRNLNTTWNFHANSKELVQKFQEKYKINYETSESKVVPLCIRNASLNVQKEFLRTYFLCEGSVQSGNEHGSSIEIVSKSKEMVRVIQMMSLNIGSFGKIYPKEVDGEIYYRFIASGEDARKWQEEITPSTFFPSKVVREGEDKDWGIPNSSWMAEVIHEDCFNSDRKLQHLLLNTKKKDDFTKAKFSKIKEIKNNYKFGISAKLVLDYLEDFWSGGYDIDYVKSIEQLETQPTFNITMKKGTFWSNGFISCNNCALTNKNIRRQAHVNKQKQGVLPKWQWTQKN